MPLSIWWIGFLFLLTVPMTLFGPVLFFIAPQIAKWHTLLLHMGFVGLVVEAALASAGRNWLFVGIGWFVFCGVDQAVSQSALSRFEAEVRLMNARTVPYRGNVQDLVVGAEPLGERRQIAGRLQTGYDLTEVFDFPDRQNRTTSRVFRSHDCVPHAKCLQFANDMKARAPKSDVQCYNKYCLYSEQEAPRRPEMRIDATRESTWLFNSKMMRVKFTAPDGRTSEAIWGQAGPHIWYPSLNMRCFKERANRGPCDAFTITEATMFGYFDRRGHVTTDNLYSFIARMIEINPQLTRTNRH